MTRSCLNCWFATLRLPAADVFKARARALAYEVCAVHDRRVPGGCAAWEEERPGLPAPTTRDVNMARAMYRASERVRA